MTAVIDNQYIKIPSVTTTERNALSASNGMVVYNSTDAQFQKYEAGSWLSFGGSTSFTDSTFEIKDNGDTTKKLAFQVSGVTTGTTRTLTVQDVNGSILVSDATTVSLPKRGRVFSIDFKQPVGTAGITIATSTSQAYNFYCVQTTEANNDEFSFSLWLQAGTYTLDALGITASTLGKLDWYIDGSITGITGQDWYSGATAFNVSKTGSVTLSTSGYHKFVGKINGKNASSSSYKWAISTVSVYPSAD